MSEIDSLIKFFQSPLGRMIINATKDVATRHVIPYVRQNMSSGGQPMSEAEQEQRAKEEFADVSGDFDIPGEVQPSENDANNKAPF